MGPDPQDSLWRWSWPLRDLRRCVDGRGTGCLEAQLKSLVSFLGADRHEETTASVSCSGFELYSGEHGRGGGGISK